MATPRASRKTPSRTGKSKAPPKVEQSAAPITDVPPIKPPVQTHQPTTSGARLNMPPPPQYTADMAGPAIASILTRVPSISRMTDGIRAYLDKLNEFLAKSPVKVESLTHADVECALAVNNDNVGILIFFSETCALNSPPTDNYMKIKTMIPDVSVRASLVVTPDDYIKASQMATYLQASLGNIPLDDVTYASFTNASIIFNYNKPIALQTLANTSPHSQAMRTDFGITIELKMPTPMGQPPRTKPLAVVTGYVKFSAYMDPNTNQPKMAPTVVCNEIIPVLPSAGMLGFILPMIADSLIIRRGWVTALSMAEFGTLFIDQTNGKPTKITTPQQLVELINKSMCTPFFAVEVADGRSRLLGMDSLMNNNSPIYKNIDSFLMAGGTIQNAPNKILHSYPVWTGYCKFQGETVSLSTVTDYVKLVSKNVPVDIASQYLKDPMPPHMTLVPIQNFISDVQVLYSSVVIIFSADFIMTMGNYLRQVQVNIQLNGIETSENTMMTQLASAPNNFIGRTFIASQLPTARINPY